MDSFRKAEQLLDSTVVDETEFEVQEVFPEGLDVTVAESGLACSCI